MWRAVSRRFRPGFIGLYLSKSMLKSKQGKNHLPGLSRLARESKYERVSCPQTSGMVKLPNDLNFWGIELQTGYISLSAILQTMIRGHSLHFFNPDKTSSFMDLVKLLREHLIFIKYAEVHISSDIYCTDVSKHPISVGIRLVSWQKSTFVYEVVLLSLETTFATFTVNGICISKETRKSVMLPEWWQDKYRSLYEETPALMYFKELQVPKTLFCRGFLVKPYTFPVPRRDMDWN